MNKFTDKIFNICDRHFFARSHVSNSKTMLLKFGPVGELIKNNIYHEWYLENVIKTENVYPYYTSNNSIKNFLTDLQEPFLHAKHWSIGQLPFGVSVSNSENCCKEANDTLDCMGLNPEYQTLLRLYMFLSPTTATSYFDEWQQRRKIWWRKISAYPGRFSLSDVKNEESCNISHILAKFPWGERIVETFQLMTSDIFTPLNKELKIVYEAKDGRRKVVPHVLVSSVQLESAVLTFLCDAYDEIPCQDSAREIMRFHRKLAPYKTSFAAASSTTAASEDLSELAQFLAKQLRNIGISALLLPDVTRKSLESQFIRNDELGIPYTVVMNDTTLKTGIIGLRSRDTSLREQLHVTDLKKYMKKLFQNY